MLYHTLEPQVCLQPSETLPTHQSVRDLGIMVNESLTPSSHIAKIAATAHQRVNLIFRTFVSRDVNAATCLHYLRSAFT